MATSVILPPGSYGPGTFTLPAAPIPTGITRVTVQVDRASMVSGTLHIDWTLELSQDSGTSWLPWGGAGTVGGAISDPATGLPFSVSSFTVAVPNPANAGRRLRGSVTLTEAVVTSVTLVTSP